MHRVARKLLSRRTLSSSACILPQDTNAALWASSAVPKVPKVGTTRIFYKDNVTALYSLGENFQNKEGPARRELVRKAVGSAVKAVQALDGIEDVSIDASLDPHAAAVASHLANYEFTLKTKTPSPRIRYSPIQASQEWDKGAIYAEAQNLARTLMEMPANMMTPTVFCQRVQEEFAGIDDVEIVVRDEDWAEKIGMRSFLSVTRGTSEPAKFLEIHYKGAPSDVRPFAMVGKGVTFDSGGISIKPSGNMKLMRGDMGGAATVVSAALAVAKLKLPVNMVAITPLAENMPGPSATKPGDVIYAMNGKSIEVDNTDAEGRLVLADAIYYASSTFKPHTLIDVATLTGAMDVALGSVYSGVFTNSDSLWSELQTAGAHEYDRFWRMPLDEDYGPQIYSSNADLCNTGGRSAGSCTAALFLQAFLDSDVRWAHIDIAGTMAISKASPYMGTGMTGRPVRGLVEFVRRLEK